MFGLRQGVRRHPHAQFDGFIAVLGVDLGQGTRLDDVFHRKHAVSLVNLGIIDHGVNGFQVRPSRPNTPFI